MNNLSVKAASLCILLLALICNHHEAKAIVGTVADCEKPRVTYHDCAHFILASIKALPSDLQNPEPIFKLSLIWDSRFQKEYQQFLRDKNANLSQSDIDKFKEKIGNQINPIDIVQDKIEEKVKKEVAKWVVKRFAELAPLVHFLSAKIVTLTSTAIGAFLTPSEIATDWHERKTVNDEIQERIGEKLAPFFKPDWKIQLKTQIGPTLDSKR